MQIDCNISTIVHQQKMLSKSNILVRCPTHISSRETLVHICLDPNCEGQPLLCKRCTKQGHKGHQIATINEFADSISRILNDKSVEEKGRTLRESLQKQKAKVLSQIGILRDDIDEQLILAEVTIAKCFDRLEANINTLLRDQKVAPLSEFKMYSELTFVEIDEIHQQLRDFFTKRYLRSEVSAKLKKLESDCSSLSLELSAMIRDIQSEFDAGLRPLISVVNIESEYRIAPCRFGRQPIIWSQSLKHADIRLNQLTAFRVGLTTNKSVCCLSDRLMDDSSHESYRWVFRANNLVGLVRIGMCVVQKVISNAFVEPDWRVLGHGHYCIGSHGGVLSDIDQKLNWTMGAWKFYNGDILKFQYNPVKAKLKVIRGNDFFEMDVAFKKGQKYRVCTYLMKEADELEIVNV